MNLGKYFTLSEMTKTEQPYDNSPELWQVVNLVRLVTMVGDPLRVLVGRLNISSGFRSERVNRAVGGAPNSFHLLGLAIDVWSDRYGPRELVERLGGLEYDKAIIYDDKEILHIQIAAIGSLARGEKYERINGDYHPI